MLFQIGLSYIIISIIELKTRFLSYINKIQIHRWAIWTQVIFSWYWPHNLLYLKHYILCVLSWDTRICFTLHIIVIRDCLFIAMVFDFNINNLLICYFFHNKLIMCVTSKQIVAHFFSVIKKILCTSGTYLLRLIRNRL